jgi:hypothetical protein
MGRAAAHGQRVCHVLLGDRVLQQKHSHASIKAQENTHTVFPRTQLLPQRRNLRQALRVLTAARKS